jgi:hypothetical protein
VGQQPREVAIADLNVDGVLDVAVANSGDGSVSLLLGTPGTTSLHLLRAVPAGREPSDLDALDIDQDADPDLVIANHETPYITVLFNDG